MSGSGRDGAYSHADALAVYRATAQRIAAWWVPLDYFDRPNLRAPRVVAADQAIQAAFAARSLHGVQRACNAWEQAIGSLRPAAPEAAS